MALPSSGAISLNDIQTEFGGENATAINEYYAGGAYVEGGITGANGAVPTSGQISFSQFQGTTGLDPYWKNVTFLLHGNGSNGGTNNTFTDSSSGNLTITKGSGTLGPAPGTFTPYGDDWSVKFNGIEHVKFPQSTNNNISTGDFTIEGWVNLSVINTSWDTLTPSNQYFFDIGANGTYFGYRSDTGSRFVMYAYGGSYEILTYSFTPTVGTWYHFAITRSGDTFRLFIDGDLKHTNTLALNLVNSTWSFGNYGNGGNYGLNGFLSNMRVVKGTALYTSNFTPSTTPLTAVSGTAILTCNSHRFKDDSSNNFTATPYAIPPGPIVSKFSPFNARPPYETSTLGGAVYFPNYVQAADNSFYEYPYYLTTTSADVNLSGTNYTFETWFYFTNDANGGYPSESMPLFNWWNAFNDRWGFVMGSGGFSIFSDGPAASFEFYTTVHINAWHHIAITWDGTYTKCYFNGTQIGSSSTTNWSRNISNLYLARNRYNYIYGPVIGDLAGFTGYMCDPRITKSVVYTGNFTPPTTPLTAITNTKFLLNSNLSVIDHAAVEHNYMTTQGNAQLSTTQKKFGTASLYFDGTGDYLESTWPPNERTGNIIGLSKRLRSRSFDTADFTIEAWIYIAGNSQQNAYGLRNGSIVSCLSPDGNSANGWDFMILGDGSTTGTALRFLSYGNSTTKTLTYTTTISQSTWHHVAVTQSGGSLRLFLNGTLGATGTGWGTGFSVQSDYVLRVGYADTAQGFNGYIDELRITNGVARYTAGFTAPTSPFPNR